MSELGIDRIERCTLTNNRKSTCIAFICRTVDIAKQIKLFIQQRQQQQQSIDHESKSSSSQADDVTNRSINNNNKSHLSNGYIASLISPAVDLIGVIVRGIPASFFFSGGSDDKANNYTCLGITISDNLSWSQQFERLLSRARSDSYLVSRLIQSDDKPP